MSFAFRHQPLKTIYTVGWVFYLVAAIPVWIVTNIIPSARPRRSWPLARCVLVKIAGSVIRSWYQTSLPPNPPLDHWEKNAKELGFVPIRPTPELVIGVIREFAEKNGVEAVATGGFWLGPRGPGGEAGQRASPDERVVYLLHGGGHVSGSAHPKQGAAPLYEGYLEHLGPNVRIFGLEYRISTAAPFQPSNPFPASLIDAIAGYRYLVEDVGFKPSQVVFSGDSAGGGIALNLVRYLALGHTQLSSLPIPAGLILLSPTMDWAGTHDGAESAIVRNAHSDYCNVMLDSGYTRRALVGNLGEQSASRNTWISPGARNADWQPGMFAGLPRTVMFAGDAEYTLDPMRTVKDRLMEDMGKERMQYIEVPDATHDVTVMPWLEPERTKVLREIAAWVKTVW